MRYSYRGSSYDAQPASVDVTETESMGVFLGNSFTLKQLTTTQRRSTPTPLKYRGVDYIN